MLKYTKSCIVVLGIFCGLALNACTVVDNSESSTADSVWEDSLAEGNADASSSSAVSENWQNADTTTELQYLSLVTPAYFSSYAVRFGGGTVPAQPVALTPTFESGILQYTHSTTDSIIALFFAASSIQESVTVSLDGQLAALEWWKDQDVWSGGYQPIFVYPCTLQVAQYRTFNVFVQDSSRMRARVYSVNVQRTDSGLNSTIE